MIKVGFERRRERLCSLFGSSCKIFILRPLVRTVWNGLGWLPTPFLQNIFFLIFIAIFEIPKLLKESKQQANLLNAIGTFRNLYTLLDFNAICTRVILSTLWAILWFVAACYLSAFSTCFDTVRLYQHFSYKKCQKTFRTNFFWRSVLTPI